jgi:uncharacterized protein
VGLGADFAIQFSMRYRAQRHEKVDLRSALVETARLVGAPLTLAALAAAAGFLSFVPTNYRGVAELGMIAGCGKPPAPYGTLRHHVVFSRSSNEGDRISKESS